MITKERKKWMHFNYRYKKGLLRWGSYYKTFENIVCGRNTQLRLNHEKISLRYLKLVLCVSCNTVKYVQRVHIYDALMRKSFIVCVQYENEREKENEWERNYFNWEWVSILPLVYRDIVVCIENYFKKLHSCTSIYSIYTWKQERETAKRENFFF